MKHFLIRYRFRNGSPEAWHDEVARFIAELENDPDLKGRISYRCMKEREGPGYYHLAASSDDQAIGALRHKDFFIRYTEATKRVAGGEVEVMPLEIVAETAHRA